MTLDLPLELEARLREEAAKEGLAPDRFALNMLEERLQPKQAGQSAPHLSKAESELMIHINEGLAVETWRQYHELVAKRNAGTLTTEEQHSLIDLIDQVEIAHARRLEYVLELAKLRGTTLDALMDTLGIVRPTYV